MKKLFLLSLILISILVLSQCKKEHIPDDNPSDSTEVEHLIKTITFGSYDGEHGFKNMTYKNGRYDSALVDYNYVKFSYKNNRLDYYMGAMFGLCDVRVKKKYHYLNDTLIDYIEFSNSYKDDTYLKIQLKYNGANQINYYRLSRSLDPYYFYLYDWSADDIAKATAIDYNYHVVPDSVVGFVDIYNSYTDTLNPLRAVNDIYFLTLFLTKHLPRNMTRIAYTYDIDHTTSPYTRSLVRVDTLHYHFSYDYNQLGLLESVYMNNKRTIHILYN